MELMLVLYRSMFDYVVEITVGNGDKAKVFKAHSNLLAHHSAYFRSLQLQSSSKGLSLVIEGERVLQATNPDLFGVFRKFIYSSQVVLPRSPTKNIPVPQSLFAAYYLADNLSAIGFKNAIVDQLTVALKDKTIETKKILQWARTLFGRVKAPEVRRMLIDVFFLYHRSNTRSVQKVRRPRHSNMKRWWQ